MGIATEKCFQFLMVVLYSNFYYFFLGMRSWQPKKDILITFCRDLRVIPTSYDYIAIAINFPCSKFWSPKKHRDFKHFPRKKF